MIQRTDPKEFVPQLIVDGGNGDNYHESSGRGKLTIFCAGSPAAAWEVPVRANKGSNGRLDHQL
jgi:hypothetical protein